jgi:hypothetical protein
MSLSLRSPLAVALLVVCLTVVGCREVGPTTPGDPGGVDNGGPASGGQPSGGGDGVAGPDGGGNNQPEARGSPLRVPNDRVGPGAGRTSPSQAKALVEEGLAAQCPGHRLCVRVVYRPENPYECLDNPGVDPASGSTITSDAIVYIITTPCSEFGGGEGGPSPSATLTPDTGQASAESGPS